MPTKPFTALLFVIFSLLSRPAPLQAMDEILFVYFDKFEPFSWAIDGEMKGIFVDAVNEIFQNRLKMRVNHSGFPWIRAQRMVKTGAADGMCTISTCERSNYTFPTEFSIIETEFKIYTGSDNIRLKELKKISLIPELKGFRIIDMLGSGWAESYLTEYDVQYEKTYNRLFILLENNRYDVSIRNNIQTNYLINKLGYEDKIVELPQSIVPEKESYRILISHNSELAKHLKEINDVLREMHADGTLSRIKDKYLVKSELQ
ncbi:putative ABC transporter, periplasmic binding domain protein [Desulfosarcina variabilis str. Montpellier]|uniref:substrate-binding periplasmic protein n=1 Tax=Desulfosarcina variabilis TaxID=2300 RepID=UPI003AFA7269